MIGDDSYSPQSCDDGYHCIAGSKSPRPGCLDKQEGTGEICPLGSYCESGLANPCPAGKVCDKYGEKTIDDLKNSNDTCSLSFGNTIQTLWFYTLVIASDR